MTLALALSVLAALAAPHAFRLDRAAPATAATIWMAALMLRALVAVYCALFVVVYLPQTELFATVTHWCLHEALPFAAVHLGLDGHRVGDVAVLAPVFFLAVSLAWVLFGVSRGARRVHRLLVRQAIGHGPSDSLIVGGSEVFVAAAGLRQPALLVSAGALTRLDDEELAASLDHERAHIAHRHRFVLVAAEAFRALARPLPGTRGAARELAFHLERDADRFASQRHDPLALASAICKAAAAPVLPVAATALAGGDVVRRVQLLTEETAAPAARRQAAAAALAALLAALVVGVAGLLPAAAHAAYHGAPHAAIVDHCAS